VSIQTVWQWRHSGLLHTHSYNDQNHCLYEDPGPTVPRCRSKPTLRSGLSRGAVWNRGWNHYRNHLRHWSEAETGRV